ncbi:hypothetical protein [Aeromicrobium sp. Leaf350]|uniref:hypothetical protein n=1 Tax=Aeromicrobium sp. Leaf350 TaxID=2876565 RepID=UPI001E4781A5|nr:hypothetical protein [Aeromicrobium sp. Leaf350]
MNQLRLMAALALVGTTMVIIGCVGPWSTIEETSYAGINSVGTVPLALAVLVALAGVLGFGPPHVAAAVRWVVLPLAYLALLFTALAAFSIVTSTAADVAQYEVGGTRTREAAWGLWMTLAGTVVATAAGALALLVPSPRASASRPTS